MYTCCDGFHGKILSPLNEKQQTQKFCRKQKVVSKCLVRKASDAGQGNGRRVNVPHVSFFSFKSRQLDSSVLKKWRINWRFYYIACTRSKSTKKKPTKKVRKVRQQSGFRRKKNGKFHFRRLFRTFKGWSLSGLRVLWQRNLIFSNVVISKAAFL